MNIYMILADENLFHPYYLRGMIKSFKKNGHNLVGITLAKDKYKHGFINAVYQQINLWGLYGFGFIAVISVMRIILHRLRMDDNSTVKGVARNYEIPIMESFNVNNSDHIIYLKSKKIDVIISSCGHYFKKELLKLPRIACINRHSSLLPKYGGVLPVFWAMKNNETEFGVSIHYMVEKIDQGNIISQNKIRLNKKNSLFLNYMFAFDSSIGATEQALVNIKKHKIVGKFKPGKKEYFSFPTKKDIDEFKTKFDTFALTDPKRFYQKYS